VFELKVENGMKNRTAKKKFVITEYFEQKLHEQTLFEQTLPDQMFLTKPTYI
jgi:hypothetical protein